MGTPLPSGGTKSSVPGDKCFPLLLSWANNFYLIHFIRLLSESLKGHQSPAGAANAITHPGIGRSHFSVSLCRLPSSLTPVPWGHLPNRLSAPQPSNSESHSRPVRAPPAAGRPRERVRDQHARDPRGDSPRRAWVRRARGWGSRLPFPLRFAWARTGRSPRPAK